MRNTHGKYVFPWMSIICSLTCKRRSRDFPALAVGLPPPHPQWKISKWKVEEKISLFEINSWFLHFCILIVSTINSLSLYSLFQYLILGFGQVSVQEVSNLELVPFVWKKSTCGENSIVWWTWKKQIYFLFQGTLPEYPYVLQPMLAMDHSRLFHVLSSVL